MSVPIYQIGDLVTLKPDCWKHLTRYENSVGIITGFGFHSDTDETIKSFIVMFELKNTFTRIIWHNDILKHYPVVK